MSKYNAQKTTVNGITFDSKKEANYYCELMMLQAGGVVKKFDMQVPYELQPGYRNRQGKKIRPIKYLADFVVEFKDGHKEVVDVKGFRTKEYELKKKLLLYKYPEILFKEV